MLLKQSTGCCCSDDVVDDAGVTMGTVTTVCLLSPGVFVHKVVAVIFGAAGRRRRGGDQDQKVGEKVLSVLETGVNNLNLNTNL